MRIGNLAAFAIGLFLAQAVALPMQACELDQVPLEAPTDSCPGPPTDSPQVGICTAEYELDE